MAEVSIFDSKNFNAEVFGKYVETVPRVKQNALIKAGVLRTRSDIISLFNAQTGSNYATIPMLGLIGGDPLNYDGNTNITATNLETFSQSAVVVGRMAAWEEKDFSYDITAGTDFMSQIGAQTVNYWDDVDQLTMLKVLAGIFSIDDGSEFVDAHTYDITETATPIVNATTLNNAIQKAAGANKNIFTLVIMHSAIATTLENLQLLNYFQGTDEKGLIRDTALATWNGRTVLIDDDVPVVDGAYTSYVLGTGAFDYADVGAKVPYEVYRNPTANGGTDMLINRQRKLFAPRGISYINSDADNTVSPTDNDLANGAHWKLAVGTKGSTFDHRAIPIAQIIGQAE